MDAEFANVKKRWQETGMPGIVRSARTRLAEFVRPQDEQKAPKKAPKKGKPRKAA